MRCAAHTLRAWRRALWSHWMMSCRSAVPGSAVLSPNWMMMRKGRTGQSFKPMGIDRWALGWCQVRRIFFSSLDKKSRPPFSLSLWKGKAGKQGIIRLRQPSLDTTVVPLCISLITSRTSVATGMVRLGAHSAPSIQLVQLSPSPTPQTRTSLLLWATPDSLQATQATQHRRPTLHPTPDPASTNIG